MLTRKPLTIFLLVCISAVCLSVIAAVLCHNKDDDKENKCGEYFGLPILALCCIMCCIAIFAVFYVESMGHSTGMRN